MGIHTPAVFLNQLSAVGEATGNRQQLDSEHRLATSKPWDVSARL